MHRVDLTPVYILHTRFFRNTSLIVELFSQTHGHISVVARSARGPQSRYKGQLQLFSPMLASWFGLHELKTLGNTELNSMPLQLNQNALFCGFYLNELIMRLLQKEDPHPQLFNLYHESLCQLEKSGSGSGSGRKNTNNLPAILRLFEKKLLENLGYGLPLTHDVKTREKIQSDCHYEFIPNQGFFLSNTTSHHQNFSGADLMAIHAEKFDTESVANSAKRLMRLAISHLLGNNTLKSRELF